jgi:hypothetical protein
MKMHDDERVISHLAVTCEATVVAGLGSIVWVRRRVWNAAGPRLRLGLRPC